MSSSQSARRFMHTYNDRIDLSRNAKHRFAMEHAMSIYPTRSCYTYIPKNACSTLRFSVAQSNGFVRSIDDVSWIHNNNKSFLMKEAEVATCEYAFVVLRCPFARLYSAFMDKIVGFEVQAWQFRNSTGNRFELYDLSFEVFVNYLSRVKPSTLDHHWRPQSDFLVLDQYDDYFCFENIPNAFTTIEEKAGIRITDTRKALKHDTSSLIFDKNMKSPDQLPALELLVQKRAGIVPCPELMFRDSSIDAVQSIYGEDLALYEANFGKSSLMKHLT